MVISPTAAPTSSNATFAYFRTRPTKSAPQNHRTRRIPTSKSATFALDTIQEDNATLRTCEKFSTLTLNANAVKFTTLDSATLNCFVKSATNNTTHPTSVPDTRTKTSPTTCAQSATHSTPIIATNSSVSSNQDSFFGATDAKLNINS